MESETSYPDGWRKCNFAVWIQRFEVVMAAKNPAKLAAAQRTKPGCASIHSILWSHRLLAAVRINSLVSGNAPAMLNEVAGVNDELVSSERRAGDFMRAISQILGQQAGARFP